MTNRASREILATYRLQLNPDFTFDHVCALLPFFQDLGISHLYLSPVLKAVTGSTHGYDGVNPSAVNPELGGEAGFERLLRALASFGIGLILDVVPNHMATAGRQNPWWWDVLKKGPESRFAGFFDIDWCHPDPAVRGKVLVPVLGEPLDRCLEAGRIRLGCSGEGIRLVYFDHEFPVSGRSLAAFPDVAGGAGPPDAAVAAINADPACLKAFLDRQYYSLCFWRRAATDLNYRRFFDIHHLIGICVEKEGVFAATHRRVLEWVDAGKVDGLRIDHPDGLRDPSAYLNRLRRGASGAWIVVEKILEMDESLASGWPVEGTTGYDFLNHVNGLFVDPSGEPILTDFYREFTGRPENFRELAYEKKHRVMAELFGSELCRLENLLAESCRMMPEFASSGKEWFRPALTEMIACFPVYRTYIRPDSGDVCDKDRSILRRALADARRRQPDIPSDVWRWIEEILLLKQHGDAASEFVWRFQQLTGPVMAKGVEDTAFYNFNRLISLNEVGGDPGRFGISLDGFHAFCCRMHARWPRSLLATATHDTKRGEDARLRIDLLSEIPLRWAEAVRRWARMNARFRKGDFPDPNTEYFLYQTLIGAWPITTERIVPAMRKAAREAKAFTSWMDPDPGFEEALRLFVEGILGNTEFTEDLAAFLKPLARPAAVASLSQALIRCTAPGVPDVYQGTELWDRNLMDPDNRRPVDYDLRRRFLSEIGSLSLSDILSRYEDGIPKIFLLQRVLAARRRYPEIFGPEGEYRPLTAFGERCGHLVAYMRGGRAVILAPHRVVGLSGDWKNTVIALPAGAWQNALSGERFESGLQPLSELLERFPVALLICQPISHGRRQRSFPGGGPQAGHRTNGP